MLIDSRKLNYPAQTLFVAIKTSSNDGHGYIPDLIERGVASFLVSKKEAITSSANFILVRDTKRALQKWAQAHREQFSYPVIGIAGSNGKTIVKEWLYQLLHQDKRIVRSPKSYNSQVGVPLSLLQMKSHHELGIFEAGISEPVEMMSLKQMIQPTLGIFTNIGDAHASGFLSIEQKLNEKLQLFNDAQTLICCSDQKQVMKSVSLAADRLFTWGENTDSTVRIVDRRTEGDRTFVRLEYEGTRYQLWIPFTDDASFENAMHCVAAMLYFQIDENTINTRLAALHAIEMRLFQKQGINDCLIIQDYYNSDLHSLEVALNFAKRQHRGGRFTVILSDIYQSELEDSKLYAKVAELMRTKSVDRLFAIGSGISKHSDYFTGIESQFFSDTEQFMTHFQADWFGKETILLKGARVFEFEQIERRLDQKIHRTVLEINLNSLADNLNYFRSKLEPETKLMAMVKAHSYGSGSHEIAKLLEAKGVDYLAVAYTQEGVRLREDGVTLPIMVMNPEEDNLSQLLDYGLEANVYSFGVLNSLIDCLQRSGHVKARIHLEFDTGMARLGFNELELEELIERIQSASTLRVASVFSHLAAADEEQHKNFTIEQCERFKPIGERVKEVFGQEVIMHTLNSAGALAYPEYQFDMIRLGIGLYGINPTATSAELSNVYTLKSYISQIRFVPADESVGYSRRGVADQERRIAVLPIGYADGWNRLLSNGNGSVKIKGIEAPIVGNVCMDMCMVDVSHINCDEGDLVVLFSTQEEIEDIAKASQTIPYEVLTSISQRVQRVFIEE